MSLVKDGPFAGAMTGIEYECLQAVGSNLGIKSLKAVIKLIHTADSSGMDAMSMGVTISWAMESFERGVFTKEDFKCEKYPDGFEPYFGAEEEAVAIAELIAKREGIGDLLSKGTRIASEITDKQRGTQSYQWAMQIKGLENPGYDARALKTFAVGLAAGTRGGCHNRSAAYDPDIKGSDPDLKITVDRFTVDENRGKVARSTEEYAAVYDTLPLCKFIRRSFTGKADRAGAWPAIAKLINATTGWNFTYDDVELIGERAHTIKKAFNIREGWTEQDDHLPYRWLHEAFKEGASKDTFVTDDELKYLKKLYYEAKGWTKDGFIPKEKLITLGMEDIAEEIGV